MPKEAEVIQAKKVDQDPEVGRVQVVDQEVTE